MTARSPDVTFADVADVIRSAIAQHTMPGGQVSIRWHADGQWHAWDAPFGSLTYDANSSAVALDTPYDLASVTKAIVALSLIRLASRKAIDLATRLGDVLDEARDHEAHACTLEQLASHRSQLPAWYPFFRAVMPAEAERGGAHARIIADVACSVLEPSGGAARYSDLGYILLGESMQRVTGVPLQTLVRDEVTVPLGLDPVVHYRGITAPFREPHIAPTELCPWRERLVQGNVHDENAYALGGVAGHAGLFGTSRALAEIGRASLDALGGVTSWFDPAWMARMVAPRAGGTHRLGWDGKSAEGSSAGSQMSAATFGHLGFTGTSVWCDPEARVAIALLTNRVHPTRDNAGIRTLRVAVHDAALRALRA